MPVKEIDLEDFARRVERLCDFLIDKFPFMDGSEDIVIIQKLKDEAADLQVSSRKRITIEGLHAYIHGG